MALAPVFHGRIDNDGRFQLAEEEKAQRQAYFRTLAGKRVEIIVRKERTKRSIDQNAYLHAVAFPLLADHFGLSVEATKLVLMGEHFGWIKVAGHDIPFKAHTSDMTVEECTKFIDWLLPWAMEEHQVSIPLPNEAVPA